MTLKLPVIYNETLSGGSGNVRLSITFGEVLSGGSGNVRNPIIYLEALFPVPPELPMSTDIFPGFGNSSLDPSIPQGLDPFNSPLPGLAFSVHKIPSFKTRIDEAASGNEVRNALQKYPRWDFELTYEFLEDRTGADSSLKTILGFFLARQGSFDSWLFKDPDDYQVTNGTLGNADGGITQFPFIRTIGVFDEKVCQVDTANAITLYHTIDEANSIPGSGPYTITVSNAASFVEDKGVIKAGGIPLVKVSGAPAINQYSVDILTGVYTFNSGNAGNGVTIRYRYTIDPLDYTVTMPNLVIFGVAPEEGVISASFQFFFACRFIEDQMDFEKFYDKLWNLQECNFRSIIQ